METEAINYQRATTTAYKMNSPNEQLSFGEFISHSFLSVINSVLPAAPYPTADDN